MTDAEDIGHAGKRLGPKQRSASPRGPEPVLAEARSIQRAARAIRAGELVVFPTETVYGLGADALNPEAVRRVYEAKGRPPDNPLIIHVSDARQARRLVRLWTPSAGRLAGVFWPGPLTLVLPKSPVVPGAATAELDSIAIRVPAHPVALALLREAKVPIAAPSANRSGRPSPTRVEHARDDLGDRVAIYLDGGPTPIGVESTIVSLLGDAPVILRPGGVDREALESIIGHVEVSAPPRDGEPVRSPGLKYRHYAPEAAVFLVPPDALEFRAKNLRALGLRVAIAASREYAPCDPDVRIPGSRDDPGAWAHALFAILREVDHEGYDAIVVEEIPQRGIGAAVMNRLLKAAQPRSAALFERELGT